MEITFQLQSQAVLSPPKGEEMALLVAAREMDKNALMEIFDLYSSAIYAYAVRLCHDSHLADTIVGDVFAKLLDQFSTGHGPNANLRSYLYEMTYHLVVDQARYANRVLPFEAMDFIHYDGYSNFINLENKILFEMIMQAIRKKLTNDQRHVIILRFLEGFSLRETAKIIGKEVNHVKVIQNRAITTLRKALENRVIE